MLAIMSALTEEIEHLVAEMGPTAEIFSRGMRNYHKGVLWGTPVVLVFSRWGKVSAAATSACLISEFGATGIIFTGVAGAVDPRLKVGDVVIGNRLYQHDMDARPLFERHEIPLLKITAIPTDAVLRAQLEKAAADFLQHGVHTALTATARKRFNLTAPKSVTLDVASGDKFFANKAEVRELRSRLPVGCVEMEGAAVAQVCLEHSIRFGLIRTISDSADEAAPIDFLAFIKEVAAVYSHGIIKNFLKNRAK